MGLTWLYRGDDYSADLPREAVSRRVRESHAAPYRAAIVPSIASTDVVLPSSVVALADEASIEIARFDAEVAHDLQPFAALLLRSESASSSQIENLTSSARAIALADQLDTEAILAMHAALMEHQDEHPVGAWRTEQVWLGGTAFGPHEASFVPPHHRHVPGAMEDLIAFVRRDDIPVLVQAGLAHAQFETIHPFTDGNGRTGRALLQAMFRARELTRMVTIPVSAGLLTDVDSYFSALTAYRQGDASMIVTKVAEASVAAIANGRRLVAELSDIRHRWADVVSARRDAIVWRLADVLLARPVINAETAQRELGATSANTHRALRQLAEAGVITEFSGRQRRRLWQAREVIAALDDFAARAGRRRSGRP